MLLIPGDVSGLRFKLKPLVIVVVVLVVTVVVVVVEVVDESSEAAMDVKAFDTEVNSMVLELVVVVTVVDGRAKP